MMFLINVLEYYRLIVLHSVSFQEHRGIDLSWQQRHLQMTPLFAATLSSQTQQSLSEGGSYGAGGGIRATQQGLAFTPTQGKKNIFNGIDG